MAILRPIYNTQVLIWQPINFQKVVKIYSTKNVKFTAQIGQIFH